ncbi:PAS domain-containing protein [Phreatobacter sp. HK31-P]
MTDTESSSLFTYWDQLRAGRPAPDRAEIDPRDIAPILGSTFILEGDRAGSLPYRLAGSRVCALFGREMKGVGFLDAYSDAARPVAIRALRDALAANAGLLMALTGTSTAGRTMAMEATVLPLVHRGRIGARMIGCLTAPETPYWVGRDGIRTIAVESVRLLWPNWSGADVVAREATIQPGLRPFAGRPALRVIQGGNVA